MFAEGCVIQRTTQAPASVQFILTQVIKKHRATWEKFVHWQHLKKLLFPPKNLRNRSIYRWEQQLPPVDFHHSTAPFGVYAPTCVVYEGLENLGWEIKGAQSDSITSICKECPFFGVTKLFGWDCETAEKSNLQKKEHELCEEHCPTSTLDYFLSVQVTKVLVNCDTHHWPLIAECVKVCQPLFIW